MKGTVNNITTGYVGLHYEVVNGVARNYYLAGSQRVAVREGDGTRSYLISDHLGTTAVTTNASGTGTAERRYSPNTL